MQELLGEYSVKKYLIGLMHSIHRMEYYSINQRMEFQSSASFTFLGNLNLYSES